MSERRVDPPGTTPWDRWAGARVGGLAGAAIGVLPAIWVSGYPLAFAVGFAAVGAVVGFLIERSRSRR